jgi:membrane fusion protein (multidrug efflux system)
VDVLKSAGDPVKTGDVLARFDLPSAAQTVSRLTADLAAAEAQVESARINRDKVRGFVERGLVARRELETADRELADAQGVVDRARTTQSAAQAGAVRAVVRAPFDGVVATRFFNPGDMVLSTTAPILRIVDPRRLEIVASVPRKDQSRVVTGATARVAAAGPEPVRLNVAGRVTDLSAGLPAGLPAGALAEGGALAKADVAARGLAKADDSVAFRLVFVEPSTLAVDTPVQLDIDAEERTDTVLVPTEALVRDGTNTAVFVVNESRAQRRLVKTGIEDEARIEIIEGLRAGELVITRGHIGLTDGSPITVALDR